jgi:hypothetical protein
MASKGQRQFVLLADFARGGQCEISSNSTIYKNSGQVKMPVSRECPKDTSARATVFNPKAMIIPKGFVY